MEKYIDHQIQAIYSALVGDETTFYRQVCRYFSKTFSVPLPEVEKMPFDYVLRHYYEDKFESIPRNSLIDTAVELCAPELIQQKDAAVDNLVELLKKEGKIKSEDTEELEEFEQDIPEVKLPEFNMNFPEEN